LSACLALLGFLLFQITSFNRGSVSANSLKEAKARLEQALSQLKKNRTPENTRAAQMALNAYRAAGGKEAIGGGGSLQVSAPQTSKAVAFAVSQPVRSTAPIVGKPGFGNKDGDIVRGKKNEFPVKVPNAGAANSVDTKIQSVASRPNAPNVISPPIQNFEGLNGDGNVPIFGGRVLPPDTVGDVGPNHYVQAVNTLWRVFDKTGTALTPVMTLGSLWASLPGACANANDGDPIVLYDPLADRWLISQFCTVADPNNHQLIAISKTPDPTGAYYLYDFMMPNNKFNDYPHFGVWPDGYYMSDNQFNQAGTAFLGGGAFAFDRKKMLQGDPTASFVYFDVEPIDPTAGGMLPTDLDGVVTPPIGMPNVFMEFRADEFGDPLDAIRPYEFHVDFAIPANSTFTVRPDVAVAAFDARNPGGRDDIEQPPPSTATTALDSIADRLMHRLAYRTLAGGAQSFVLNFTVNVSGVNPTNAGTYQAGVRWTELRRTGTLLGTITVNDQGTYAPGSGNGAAGRNIWMASAAQDYLGNIGVGFSASSTTVFPSIAYAGRLAGDPAGLLAQGEDTIITGAGVQTSTSSRWGDYSNISVDPVDETTFWYTQEYYAVTATSDWRTRIGSFKVDAAAPAQPKGTVMGTVTNCATGAPIPGVTIMTADGFFRQSDASGNFSFPVGPGTYSVMVIPPVGYGGGCTQSVTVAGGGTATVNCCLTAVPVVAAMGSSLVTESCTPANMVLDPAETVTVSLGVKNTGAANTANLVGTLQATGGVTLPGGMQNYGVVVAGGATVMRDFTFTVDPMLTCGAPVTVSLQLQDGATNLGTVTFTFLTGTVGTPTTITYAGAPVAIPDGNAAGVTIPLVVSGITGNIGDVDFRFDGTASSADATSTTVGVNHSWIGDLQFTLIHPNGTTMVTFYDRPGVPASTFGCSSNNIYQLTLDDDGAFPPVENNCPGSSNAGPQTGSFSPSNPLSAFDGLPANGTWMLKVSDAATPDTGSVHAFSLIISELVCSTTCPPPVTPCMITCPTNITTTATAGACSAVVTYPAPTTTGTCGTVTCTPASGSPFGVGTTTVTCSATGAPMPTCSFTVTVNDTSPPSITCPSNQTVSAGANCNAVATYAATATDNCGTPSVNCVPASGATFPLGTTTVTCTATDGASNTASCTFTVTVQDTTAPTLTCPANQTIASAPNGAATAATYMTPTATDNCPGATVACVPASGSSFPVGTTTVTCTASDASPNSPDATCSFTITVTQFTPAPTISLVDPLACVGQGDVVNGSAGVTNTSAVNQAGTLTTALPAGIVGIANTCVATVGTCTINATTVSWSGTLTPGQSVSYSYQAQIGDGVANGSTHCAVTTAVFGAVSASVTACLTVNCPAAGPGVPAGANNAVSDQKPGSVLFYNLVSSSATNAATQNSRISLTNTNTTRTAYVHLFFVDGSNCAVADSFICLTPNQTATVLHSDIDPGVTGYLVAVATDATGCPINFNYLIGDEYVKLSSGHAANLAAESIAARAGGATFCAPTASDAVLRFDDVSYDAVPRVLALDNFASPADGNQTLVVVNRVGGFLSTGAFTTGTLFGILYDDQEQALSFSLAGACQVRANLNGSGIRTVPRVEQFVPAGRTGWLRLYNNISDVGLLGAALNFNANAGTQPAAFNQGHNLHKLRLSQAAVYTIPIFPPSC
jgi:hypothetical protein